MEIHYGCRTFVTFSHLANIIYHNRECKACLVPNYVQDANSTCGMSTGSLLIVMQDAELGLSGNALLFWTARAGSASEERKTLTFAYDISQPAWRGVKLIAAPKCPC